MLFPKLPMFGFRSKKDDSGIRRSPDDERDSHVLDFILEQPRRPTSTVSSPMTSPRMQAKLPPIRASPSDKKTFPDKAFDERGQLSPRPDRQSYDALSSVSEKLLVKMTPLSLKSYDRTSFISSLVWSMMAIKATKPLFYDAEATSTTSSTSTSTSTRGSPTMDELEIGIGDVLKPTPDIGTSFLTLMEAVNYSRPNDHFNETYYLPFVRLIKEQTAGINDPHILFLYLINNTSYRIKKKFNFKVAMMLKCTGKPYCSNPDFPTLPVRSCIKINENWNEHVLSLAADSESKDLEQLIEKWMQVKLLEPTETGGGVVGLELLTIEGVLPIKCPDDSILIQTKPRSFGEIVVILIDGKQRQQAMQSRQLKQRKQRGDVVQTVVPLELTLGKYLVHPTDDNYSLISCVCYNEKHYTAFIILGDIWYFTNDREHNSVMALPKDFDVSHSILNPYLLFYQKTTDSAPRERKIHFSSAVQEPRRSDLCADCGREKKTKILLPCKHLAICGNCAKQRLLYGKNICPICGKLITAITGGT